MRRADSGSETRKRAPDLEQARVVQRRAHLGTGVEDVAHFVDEDRGGRLGVLDGERPAEAAALRAPGKVDEVEPPNCAEQPPRRVANA